VGDNLGGFWPCLLRPSAATDAAPTSCTDSSLAFLMIRCAAALRQGSGYRARLVTRSSADFSTLPGPAIGRRRTLSPLCWVTRAKSSSVASRGAACFCRFWATVRHSAPIPQNSAAFFELNSRGQRGVFDCTRVVRQVRAPRGDLAVDGQFSHRVCEGRLGQVFNVVSGHHCCFLDEGRQPV